MMMLMKMRETAIVTMMKMRETAIVTMMKMRETAIVTIMMLMKMGATATVTKTTQKLLTFSFQI